MSGKYCESWYICASFFYCLGYGVITGMLGGCLLPPGVGTTYQTGRGGSRICEREGGRIAIGNGGFFQKSGGMNLKSLSVKLQTALCQKKRYVRINAFQSYSESAERMVTKYVLQEKQKDMQGKETIITLFSSYQMADVVKELAKLYRETDS